MFEEWSNHHRYVATFCIWFIYISIADCLWRYIFNTGGWGTNQSSAEFGWVGLFLAWLLGGGVAAIAISYENFFYRKRR